MEGMVSRATRITRRAALKGLSGFAAAGALASCSRERPTAARAELIRGNGPELDTLDPHKAATAEAHNVLRDMYECLARLDPAGQPVPAAAERWITSEDGLTYDITLRPRLTWSNGDRLAATDFVASFRRLV